MIALSYISSTKLAVMNRKINTCWPEFCGLRNCVEMFYYKQKFVNHDRFTSIGKPVEPTFCSEILMRAMSY